jgi:hypothetical protein
MHLVECGLNVGWPKLRHLHGAQRRDDVHPERDRDIATARLLVSDRPLWMREHLETRARSLLYVRWEPLESIAGELTRCGYVLWDEVDEICARLKVRRADGTRPFDPDKRMHRLPNGKEVTMRTWADAVALAGFNRRRAEEALIAKLDKGVS